MLMHCSNGGLTSFSPTITPSTLPRGTTCATSPSRTLSLPLSLSLFTSCTRRFSKSSGLKRPPARSFDSSSFSLSCALEMPLSSSEKSKGSSDPAAEAFEGDDEASSERGSTRDGFPPFFSKGEVEANVRVEGAFNAEQGICCASAGLL